MASCSPGVGSFAETAGFMAVDDFAHEDARRIFRLALSCAEEAGDWHLRAQVLCSMAYQESLCGDRTPGWPTPSRRWCAPTG